MNRANICQHELLSKYIQCQLKENRKVKTKQKKAYE